MKYLKKGNIMKKRKNSISKIWPKLVKGVRLQRG